MIYSQQYIVVPAMLTDTAEPAPDFAPEHERAEEPRSPAPEILRKENLPVKDKTPSPLPLDYFYGSEHEKYKFYRIPALLLTEPGFKELPLGAVVLYGLLLDRTSLSAKNGWRDEHGRVYIRFRQSEAMDLLGVGKNTIIKLFNALDVRTGVGLIERIRVGLGESDIIYVKNFATLLEKESRKAARQDSGLVKNCGDSPAPDLEDESQEPGQRFKNQTSGGLKTGPQRFENGSSEGLKSGGPEVLNEDPYLINNTKGSRLTSITHQINGDEMDGCQEDSEVFEECFSSESVIDESRLDRGQLIQIIRENLDRKWFEQAFQKKDPTLRPAGSLEELDMMIEIIADTAMSKAEFVTIGGEKIPTRQAAERLLELDSDHAAYVLEAMSRTRTEIRNIRGYVLTALYNAPVTIDSYYAAAARKDLFGEE